MPKKEALRLHPSDKFASAGLQTLKTERVERSKIFCCQQIAWEIDTALSGGNTRARLYIEGHGYKHVLEEQDAPVAGVLYTYDNDLWLTPGEALCLDLDQAQASTIAHMYITGYWTAYEEGII